MISHKHKIVFVHIPKTGGTSIEHTFGRGDCGNGHSNLKFYKNRLKNFEEYTTFCVIRNPFEKMISEYFFFKKRHKVINPIFKDCSFEEFLNLLFSIKDPNFFENNHQNWFDGHFETHRASQLSFIQPEEDLDFLVRFEDIQNGYDSVLDHLGMERIKLPHMNKTIHKHYSQYYNEDTKKIVAEKYAEDLDYFGYKFEKE